MSERSFGREILAIVSIKLQWHELESGTMFEMLHRLAPIEWDAYMRKGNIKNLKKNIYKLCHTRCFTGSSTFQTTIHTDILISPSIYTGTKSLRKRECLR